MSGGFAAAWEKQPQMPRCAQHDSAFAFDWGSDRLTGSHYFTAGLFPGRRPSRHNVFERDYDCAMNRILLLLLFCSTGLWGQSIMIDMLRHRRFAFGCSVVPRISRCNKCAVNEFFLASRFEKHSILESELSGWTRMTNPYPYGTRMLLSSPSPVS